jgi:D-glycero-D-manno-heptose 1,7-bisphosphate phosphatase
VKHRAVFLDRDGVVNALVYRPGEGQWDSPYSLEELEVLPHAAEAVRRIKQMGFLAVVVSNQPGAAKGLCTEAWLNTLTARLRQELARGGALLDGVYYCLHHPHALEDRYRQECSCRKPRPGLLLQAARDYGIDLGGSYLIGDRLADIEAGRAAGCRTIMVRSPASDLRDEHPVQPDRMCDDLLSATREVRQWEAEVWKLASH